MYSRIDLFLSDYEIVNYSDCYRPASDCPSPAPCPSRPTCKDHRFHRMADPYGGRRMIIHQTPVVSLPRHMLKGKRRYTPLPKMRRTHSKRTKRTRKPRQIIRRLRRTLRTTTHSTTKMERLTTMQMIILRRETIVRNGMKLVKVIKGFAWSPDKPLKIVEEINGLDSKQ